MSGAAPSASPKLHPGSGRRKARAFPKGRQASAEALAEVSDLLVGRSFQADELIEYLHVIQDSKGHLPGDLLAALAEKMRLALTEVYEVATFYAHFDVILDDETPPPATTIRVCDSITCMMKGAEALHAALEKDAGADIRVLKAPCMGRCHTAPVAEVGHRHVDHATADSVLEVARSGEHHAVMPDYQSLSDYQAEGGYSLLAKLRSGGLTADDAIGTMKDSKLRGLGGAGFPTGMKWDFVRRAKGPRLMAVNGDEGEPGTFKDRHYLELRPHQFLEGMLFAGEVAEVERIYLYMRDEYPAILKILADGIAALEAAGLAEPGHIVLRRGAGAYICGEESAMLESLEGKRGIPRHKPPYPTEVGLFGQPTLIHNVETLYWVPEILNNGAEAFTSHGRHDRVGLRSFSVSGHVKDPGVKLAPAGITMDELLAEYCGGMEDGHSFIGYLPGGASGGILPASKADIPLDFDTLQPHGCFIGSAAVVVLSDQDDMRAVGRNLMAFFKDESCGQCTPCRNGTEKALTLMQANSWDQDLLGDLSQVMRDASICGLGQAACNPVDSLFEHFADQVTGQSSGQVKG